MTNYFLIVNTSFCLLVLTVRSVCILKIATIHFLFKENLFLHIYHLLVWQNFSLLRSSRLITIFTQSCLFLRSFCTLLQSTLWLTVSSLSIHWLFSDLFFAFIVVVVIIIIFTSLRVFHANVSRWFSTGVWMTSLKNSPGLSSVYWPISIML